MNSLEEALEFNPRAKEEFEVIMQGRDREIAEARQEMQNVVLASVEVSRQLAEAQKALLEYAKDALDDLDNWSGYASEYFQEKHALCAERNKWLDRIAAADTGRAK